MGSKDLVVGAVGTNPSNSLPEAVYAGNILAGSPVSKKPCYLVTLEDRSKKITRFITIDKPDFMEGFVAAKGFYTDLTEEIIIKKFGEIISSTSKEQQVDIMFPSSRVLSIRSLVFNAVKTVAK